MRFSKCLWISEKFENHLEILKNIQQGSLPENSFVLCINNASKNLMDIYSSAELKKPYVNIENLLIIAICKGKNDAKDKCAEILRDFVVDNGNLDGFKDKFTG